MDKITKKKLVGILQFDIKFCSTVLFYSFPIVHILYIITILLLLCKFLIS